MDYHHHGIPLGVPLSRTLEQLTDAEKVMGATKLHIEIRNCQKPDCNKELIFTKYEYMIGKDPNWKRLKRPEEIQQIKTRMKLAIKSDWVWGYHKELYTPIKVTVR